MGAGPWLRVARSPRPHRWAAALLLLLLLLPRLALAQVPAQLVADSVTVTADGRLVAEGNVEVFYEDIRLSARRIAYSRAGDRLTLDGPILIETADGTILTAERADITPGLESGLLLGARLVLERQLQLTAARVDRIEGRYSALTRTVATSCQVCSGQAPLWEIRAAQVVHDEAARQLHFEDAQFLIRGVPVLWLPRLRLPDPTNDRASGLLLPRLSSNDRLGVGLRLPYFIALGSNRDLTLTPFLSVRSGTLEARYREAWMRGTLEVRGAVSRDDLIPGETRGYLFADGDWVTGPGTVLTLDIRAVSDDAYLRDYGSADLDRLTSRLASVRVRENGLGRVELSYTRTLREGEVQGSLPPVVFLAEQQGRLELGPGVLDYGARLDAYERTAEGPGAGARDVARIGGEVGWTTGGLVGPGIVWDARLGVEAASYLIQDDPAYERRADRITPSARVTLRWPLLRQDAGATHVLEPLLAFAWSQTRGPAVPNEDSPLVEFDEANLDALTRYPGEDAREDGARLAVGLGYTRIGADGSSFGLAFGRIFRSEAEEGSGVASGLDTLTSDWLISVRAELPSGFEIGLRTVIDDALERDKTEGRLGWSSADFDLSGSYVWLPAAPSEGRESRIAEWTLAADWRVDDNWSLAAATRYNLTLDRPSEASLGVGWKNECVEVDVSVSRRYTSSEALEPVTGIDFGIGLLGFATGGAAPAGRCR